MGVSHRHLWGTVMTRLTTVVLGPISAHCKMILVEKNYFLREKSMSVDSTASSGSTSEGAERLELTVHGGGTYMGAPPTSHLRWDGPDVEPHDATY